MFVAAGACAQTPACDQLKGVLAARIEASGVRGYGLEVVPAGTPVPPGAKAIGTCESGAFKMLYRRWGGSAAQAVVAPRPAQRPPDVQADRPLPPAPASAPIPVPQPVVRSNEATSAVPAPPEPVVPAEPVIAKPPPAPQASEFIADNWRWLAALVLLPIVAGIWAWVARRSAYDKAGLPRGPKLRA